MENLNLRQNEVLSTFEKVGRCKAINLERLGETRMMNCG